MNIRPRVLIIDDLVGKERPEDIDVQNRADYCRSLGLRDEAEQTEPRYQVIADAVISSGQRLTAAGPINDLDVIDQFFRAGWPKIDFIETNGQGELNVRCSRYWSAVITDMKFGDDDHFGLRVIENIHRIAPELPIIVVSSLNQLHLRAGESLRHATERLGAQDFLAVSGVDFDVDPAYRSTPQNMQNRLEAIGLIPDPEQVVVGLSLPVCRMLREIRALIPQDVVGQALLLGQAGSGKTHLLGYVHRKVAAVQGRQVSAVPSRHVTLTGTGEDMQSKALFGTTGATGVPSTAGAFEDVQNGGLLFLDELGELTPTSQSDLLGALQPLFDRNGRHYREVRRMGARQSVQSQCFILAATNRDLAALVDQDRFNEALLQRFANKHVHVPSLRERKSDLPLLVHHFVRIACRQKGIPNAPKIEVGLDSWEKYSETHELRELAALIESTVSLHPFKTLLTERDFWAQETHVSHTQISAEVERAPASSGDLSLGSDSVSDLVHDLDSWLPKDAMDNREFESAFQRLDSALAKAKLRLWRLLVQRQKSLTGTINLLATVRQLLGRPKIANSRSGDLAAQLFSEAGQMQRPSDPILAEIWDRRRVTKRDSEKD
jgi:two-component system, NtrC family, response regulator PilR